ncbi:MAG TPA: TetR/AcrR family transcriptional regulator [Anaerolineaceae bacterium]|nr:TetR/AcrR family transcriptional regulator [Anaerolineaceae bacterium]
MQNKQTSRDKILQSAVQLFLEEGFEATSVNDICKHAGVSKGSFYHYFETKQALFLTMMENWSSRVMQSVLSQPISVESSVKDVLVKMPYQFNAAFAAVPKGFPILVDFWRQAMADPAIWKTAVEPYRYFMGFFMRVIETGQLDGSIRKDVDSEIMARLLVSVAMGYLLEAAFDQEKADWSAITSEGLRLLLEGIGGTE